MFCSISNRVWVGINSTNSGPPNGAAQTAALESSAGVELVGVELGKLAHGHRTAPGEFLDIVFCARHVTVLIVEHRAAEMLNDIGWHAHLCERGRIFLDG
jgi:hypothetical protein